MIKKMEFLSKSHSTRDYQYAQRITRYYQYTQEVVCILEVQVLTDVYPHDWHAYSPPLICVTCKGIGLL